MFWFTKKPQVARKPVLPQTRDDLQDPFHMAIRYGKVVAKNPEVSAINLTVINGVYGLNISVKPGSEFDLGPTPVPVSVMR